MKLATIFYTFTILFLLLKGYYIIAITIALTIPLAFWLKKIKKENKIKYFSQKIKEANLAQQQGLQYKPFLNINKEKWYIIELIPMIDRLSAKRIANKAKKQKFKNFNELSNYIGINPVIKELIEKIIKF